MEIWKIIENYPDYMVSNMGRVKSCKNGIENILKPRIHSNGYLRVNLSMNNKSKDFYIHRLVCSAFIPNTDNKPCIDHINTNRTDNRVENLKWVTRSENMNNPLTLIKCSECRKGEKGAMYGKIGKDNPSSIPIIQFSIDGEFIKKWDSAANVQRELGINNISNVCKGNRRYKTAGGYIWKYYDLELYLESKLFKVFGIKNKKVA